MTTSPAEPPESTLAAVLAETDHTPIDVYEMPHESAETLLQQLEDGTAVLAFRVCEACAPQEVLDRIEDGELDLLDGDALDAQWPCEHAAAILTTTDARTIHDAARIARLEADLAAALAKLAAVEALRVRWAAGTNVDYARARELRAALTTQPAP